MTPERFLFNYAFPCTEVKLKRKEITNEKYEELEELYISGREIAREVLEEIYKPAIAYIARYAKAMGKDPWDIELLQDFWHNEHNRIIDRQEGTYATADEVFRTFCKVTKVEVLQKNEEKFLLVNFNGKTKAVINHMLPHVRAGDMIYIHQAYAVEKVEE